MSAILPKTRTVFSNPVFDSFKSVLGGRTVFDSPGTISFEATLSGYINLAIAHEGTCNIYADGLLLGSVDPLGADLVTDGDFPNADNWTLGAA